MPRARSQERRLVVNADGYGLAAGLNRGIEECIESGLVTSISVNANFAAAASLRQLVELHPHLSVGVHLNPVAGPPLADPERIPTLLDENGEFHLAEFPALLQRGRIDRRELAHELGLQIERVEELVPTVTHLDSHQNLHLRPPFFDLFLELAHRHGIERMRTHRHFICVENTPRRAAAAAFYLTHPRRLFTHSASRYLMRRARRRGMRMCDRLLSPGVWGAGGARARLEVWLRIAQGCPAGTNEIYCHPGYVDDDLRRYAKVIVEQRDGERRVLTDPRLREAFAENGVELISFHEI
jgi:predicted glycoside hydrolase/deacetylase ChbG (UPF0249 family)